MNILCLDTASDILSLTVKCDNDRLVGGVNAGGVFTLETDTKGRHSESLMAMLENLLHTACLEPKALGLLACLRGPGSFTGVRLGFSVVKGISAANGAKTVSIPTLDCMASSFLEWPITCIPAIDSRRNQYYTAIYRSGEIITNYFDAEVGYITGKLLPGEKLLLTGPDADKLKIELEKAGRKGDVFIDPNFRSGQSRNLLKKVEKKIRMNEIWDDNLGMPMYVRKSDAEEKNGGS